MAKLELESGTDVLLLENGVDALLLFEVRGFGGVGVSPAHGVATYPRVWGIPGEISKLPAGGMVQGMLATLPELIVGKELDRLGINYIFQYSFLGGRTQSGGVIADYYIPSYSLVISVLGTYWHASPEVRAKDLLQRISVLSQGIMTIFINEADVMKRARFYVSEALRGIDHSGIKL